MFDYFIRVYRSFTALVIANTKRVNDRDMLLASLYRIAQKLYGVELWQMTPRPTRYFDKQNFDELIVGYIGGLMNR